VTVVRRSATLALLLTCAVAACRPEDEPPVALEILPEGVDMAMLGMDVYMTREGIRRIRLLADTAQFMGNGEVLLHRMEMTFFDPDGGEVSYVTADAGTYQENTDDMEARGSVVVLDRREDQRLETSRIRYVAEEDRLYGDEPFTLYKDAGRTVIRGSSFESDPGMSEVVTYNSSGQSERLVTPPPPAPQTTPDSATADPTGPGEVAEDSASVPPDSTGASPEAASVPPDSTGAPPDSTGVPPDTVRASRSR